MGKKFLIALSLASLAACHQSQPRSLVSADSDPSRAGGFDLACDRLPEKYPADLQNHTLKDRIEFRPRVTLHADGSSTTSPQPVRTRDFDQLLLIAAPTVTGSVGSVEIANPRSCTRITVLARKAISDALLPMRASDADQEGRLVLRVNDDPLVNKSLGALLVRPGPNVLTITYFGSNRSVKLGQKQVVLNVEIESVISDQEQVVTEAP